MSIWWYSDQRCFFSELFKTSFKKKKTPLHNVPFCIYKYIYILNYVYIMYILDDK